MFRIFRSLYRINQFFKEAESQFRSKNWQQALDLYEKSSSKNPQYQQALIGQSKCMLNLQKHAEARKIIEGIAEGKLSNEERQDLLQLKGRIELTKPDYDKARELFEQSIDLSNKEEIRGTIYKLFCLASNKKLREHVEKLDEILRDKTKAKPYHYFEKGWTLFQTKNFAAAAAMFDRYMQLGPSNQYTHFYRGSSNRMLGNLKEAEADFRESLKHDDQFTDSLLALSDVLMANEQIKEAYEVCDKAVKLNPKVEFAVFNRAVCLFRLGEFERAEKQFCNALALNENNPFGYLYRAMCRMELGRIDEAVADFQKKISMDPENPDNLEVLMNLGMIHFRNAQYDKALQRFNQAETLNPNDPEVLHQKGNCLAVMNKQKEALEYISKAVTKAPTNLTYRYSLAAMHILKEDFKGAERVLKDCLNIDQNNPQTYLKLGEFYLKMGDKNQAMESVLKADKFAPNNPAVLFPKASMLSEMGKHEEADKILEKLVQEFPEQIEILLSRAEVLNRMGKKAENRKLLEQAAKIAGPELKAEIEKRLRDK